eukprot:3537705-Rhodomonas_salina.2
MSRVVDFVPVDAPGSGVCKVSTRHAIVRAEGDTSYGHRRATVRTHGWKCTPGSTIPEVSTTRPTEVRLLRSVQLGRLKFA